MKRQNNDYRRQLNLARMDDLQRIQFRRMEIIREMDYSKKRMQETVRSLTAKEEIPSDKWGKTAYWMSKGGKILSAVRFGLKIGKAVDAVMHFKHLISQFK